MKELVAFLKESSAIGLCVSKFSSEKIYSTERGKIGIKSHLQILQGHTAPHKNSGQKGSIARRCSKSVNLMSAIGAVPDLRNGHKTKPCTKKDARARRAAWDLAENVYKLKKYGCHAPGNKFERFRGFLELISRFEFEFCRRENYFFEGFEFLVCSCECAVACLCPRNSILNVVVSLTVHDNIYTYIFVRCIYM